MRIASLGSGSKGNATVVDTGNTVILIDCGFSLKQTRERLSRLALTPEDIQAILVTHEHSDHINGVTRLANAATIPVWASSGTQSTGKLAQTPCHTINIHEPFQIDDCTIRPVAVPHDATEPCQFVLDNGQHRLGVLTDIGHITEHVTSHYAACDALLLEANHDPALLASGPYPPALKQRVGGDFGHLNNQQAATLLETVDKTKLQQLVLMHISEQNNQPHLAHGLACEALGCATGFPMVAKQDSGFGWMELD